MKKKLLLQLLENATYRHKGGVSTCRGSINLGSGCNTCPKCEWELSRRDALGLPKYLHGRKIR